MYLPSRNWTFLTEDSASLRRESQQNSLTRAHWADAHSFKPHPQVQSYGQLSMAPFLHRSRWPRKSSNLKERQKQINKNGNLKETELKRESMKEQTPIKKETFRIKITSHK